MELVADILLVAGALGAGLYCLILARRLNRFNDLEKGVGGAVAVLSAQVDDLSKALAVARAASSDSDSALADLTGRAESVATRLELMMASMHDIPGNYGEPPSSTPETAVDARAHREPPKSPVGPMFIRHDRNQAGLAQ